MVEATNPTFSSAGGGDLNVVGREIVRACLTIGLVVRAAGSPEFAQVRWPGAEGIVFDFNKPATWRTALDGVDCVFLLRPPKLSNMSATFNPFVDAAYAAGVKHVVFMSVAGAETRRWVPHRKVEDQLKTTGAAWTILLLGFFAQNLGDAYLRDSVEDDRLFVPAAQGRVAFLDVADVGDEAARIFETPESHRGLAYRLAGPDALTFAQAAEMLSGTINRRIAYVPASMGGLLVASVFPPSVASHANRCSDRASCRIEIWRCRSRRRSSARIARARGDSVE